MMTAKDTPMLGGLRLLAAATALLSATAVANPGDDQFLVAREAFRTGERVRLARATEALRGHELQPWAEYWQLRLRLEDDPDSGPAVAQYLAREPNAFLADRLRADWVRALAKRRDWDAVTVEFPSLVQPEQDVACHFLQARFARGDVSALDDARPLWFSVIDLPEACMPLMERLIEDKRLDADDTWQRMRRLLEAKKLSQARVVGRYLPHGQEPDAKMLESIADKPARYLARLPASFSATRLGREMALYAVQRMARSDPLVAAAQWQSIEERFSATERAYAWGQIAWQAATRHLPEALTWYVRAGDAPMSDEQLAWQVRAALRAASWVMVQKTITRMPTQLAAEAPWTYWLGRALAAQGRLDDAQALWRRVAGQPNFYGNLADEELGRSIAVPPRASPPSRDELLQATDNAGLRRALALFRVDMRVEGVREWNWTLRGMDDRQLLAAAEIAHRQDVFDRAISAADRTRVQHDYAMRYLAPFRERVEPKARELDLDGGWVYGLMRQESRFVTNAKSSAGAKGLMQLMPATAKWVAKKIGLVNFHPSKVTDMDTNVTLGTHYLKLVLGSLDNHPVLASAAYNAGPSRARKWRADTPLEGAIYAETIPFNETRDYVKKVMSNSVYYNALFLGESQSLKARLGTIKPKGGNDALAEELP